ncbi:hypothetical protein KUTeg_001070 [Tegillarca granosa]|uniref:Protein AAR2 homolog n=1 Tax=Tegillarca granosa TaxID=220873 RepID=A0ABQ9G0B8_TEGGR|nr:hypothetical protein KUTeg_001070 [Tegillarca granosa]
MDQERAQMLFREGATLIFLDVPQGTEFGIDYNSWTVCSEFKGVKMIPPGIHFIYYSKNGDTAPRTGFFYNFKQKEVVVKKWDSYREVQFASKRAVSTTTHQTDHGMNYKKWVSLSNHITPGVMNRLQPVTGKICSVTEFISESSNTKSRKAAAANSDGKTYKSGTFSRDAESKIPDMKTKPGTEIRFSLFPKRYKENATPAEITHGGMDSSFQLDSMLSTYFTNDKTELLGNNFLTTTLQEFFANLENEIDVDKKLQKKGLKFRDHLTQKFKWDFTSESDEYAPCHWVPDNT